MYTKHKLLKIDVIKEREVKKIIITQNLRHLNLLENLNSSNLSSKLIHYFQKYKPHITIGFRDLNSNTGYSLQDLLDENLWDINVSFDLQNFYPISATEVLMKRKGLI